MSRGGEKYSRGSMVKNTVKTVCCHMLANGGRWRLCCGEHRVMCTIVQALYCIPETNKTLATIL